MQEKLEVIPQEQEKLIKNYLTRAQVLINQKDTQALVCLEMLKNALATLPDAGRQLYIEQYDLLCVKNFMNSTIKELEEYEKYFQSDGIEHAMNLLLAMQKNYSTWQGICKQRIAGLLSKDFHEVSNHLRGINMHLQKYENALINFLVRKVQANLKKNSAYLYLPEHQELLQLIEKDLKLLQVLNVPGIKNLVDEFKIQQMEYNLNIARYMWECAVLFYEKGNKNLPKLDKCYDQLTELDIFLWKITRDKAFPTKKGAAPFAHVITNLIKLSRELKDKCEVLYPGVKSKYEGYYQESTEQNSSNRYRLHPPAMEQESKQSIVSNGNLMSPNA